MYRNARDKRSKPIFVTSSGKLNRSQNVSLSNKRILTNDGAEKKTKFLKPQEISSNKSFFEEALHLSEYELQNGDDPHVLEQDQAMFVRDLKKILEEKGREANNVKEFMRGFEEHVNNDIANLKKALSPTKTSPSCDSARGATQDSLVRLLLNIECLQSQLIEKLLDKITEIAFSDDNNAGDMGEVAWIKFILHQMRFLDRIVDGKLLTERLFEMLQIAPDPVKREIIICLPDIITDEHHQETASNLSKILHENFELAPAILDSLSQLNIKSELQHAVCKQVLKTLPAAPVESLPNIVKFLMSGIEQDNILEIVRELRLKLDLAAVHLSEKSPSKSRKLSTQLGKQGLATTTCSANMEVLTLNNIRLGITLTRAMGDAWIKCINAVKAASEHKTLDVLVLIILHETAVRRKQVESLIRNKIRSGLFTEALMEKMFSSHVAVLKVYFKTVMDIARVLLRSPEPAVSYHGSSWYRLSFTTFENHFRQKVLSELLTHVGTGDANSIKASLSVLYDLSYNQEEKIVPHAMLLMSLQDKIEDFELSEMRQVMDILCRLAYLDADRGSVLQDSIHILIRKHLSNSNVKYKRKGIVGAIMAVKNIAASTGDDSTTSLAESSVSGIDFLPTDALKQAASLLEFAQVSVTYNTDALGLYYDQLACTINETEMNTNFLEWIAEALTSQFQEAFVIELDQVQKREAFDNSLQYALDELLPEHIVINVTGVVVKEETSKQEEGVASKSNLSIQVINPLFRLLRIVRYKLDNGNMEAVDAVLGCPVNMPSPKTIEDFENLDDLQQKLVCTSLFYCINWFRELLNAFIYEKKLLDKVLIRMRNIVHLQNILAKLLIQVPDYIPPTCQFYSTVKPPTMKMEAPKKKRGRKSTDKRKKSKKGADTSLVVTQGASKTQGTTQGDADDDEDEGESSSSNGKTSCIHLGSYRGYFRELDPDVFLIWTKKALVLNATPFKDDNPTAELGPAELEFLLEDFIAKAEHSLTSTLKRATFLKTSTPVGFYHLDLRPPEHVAKNSVKMFSPICSHLEQVSQYFQNLIELNDGVLDSPSMFMESTPKISYCFCLLFRALGSTLAWNGFQSRAHVSLLKDGLRTLASRINGENKKITSLRELVKESCQYIMKFVDWIAYLQTAVNLIKLVATIASFTEDKMQQQHLADICETYLQREWSTLDGMREKGTQFNQEVETVIKTYLNCVEDRLAAVKKLTDVVVPEAIELTGKESRTKTYKTITKSNFPIFFRNVIATLVDAAKERFTTPGNTLSEEEQLALWEVIVAVHNSLVSAVKKYSSRNVMLPFLKWSRPLLDLFLKQAMPLFDHTLRTHSQTQALLKGMQVSTRFLQNICCHSKVQKDVTLTAQVPFIKRYLEAIVYRVKAMLALNNCTQAFWLGVLKNKDIQGEIIASQSQSDTATEAGEEEEEDEVPPQEDDQSDIDLDENPKQQNETANGHESDVDSEV